MIARDTDKDAGISTAQSAEPLHPSTVRYRSLRRWGVPLVRGPLRHDCNHLETSARINDLIRVLPAASLSTGPRRRQAASLDEPSPSQLRRAFPRTNRRATHHLKLELEDVGRTPQEGV